MKFFSLSKGAGRTGREVFRGREPAVLAPGRASLVLPSRDQGSLQNCREIEANCELLGVGVTCHTMELVNPIGHSSSHKLGQDKDKGALSLASSVAPCVLLP